MAPFRRCGLEDNDEIGARPVSLRDRQHGCSSTTITSHCSSSGTISDDEISWEEESVISVMTSTSDLESVYNEASSQFRPANLRDRFLLQHQLPQPSRTVSMVLSEHERIRVLSNLAPSRSTYDVNEENDSWKSGAILDDPLLQQEKRERESWQMVYPGRVFLDPYEKGIVDGFHQDFDVWLDREDSRLSQILEREETSSKASSSS